MTRNQAVFIGVGAMVGAGIFALLGEAGAIALSAVWLSFLLAGVIAALQGYSFAYLGKKHASGAGLMGYLSAGYGKDSRVTSVFSWLVWASVMIVVAMVAVSFGSYAAATITGGDMPDTLVEGDGHAHRGRGRTCSRRSAGPASSPSPSPWSSGSSSSSCSGSRSSPW